LVAAQSMVMADTAAWGCVEMSWSCLGWVLEQRGGGDQGKEAGGLCSLSFTQVSPSDSTSNPVFFFYYKVFCCA